MYIYQGILLLIMYSKKTDKGVIPTYPHHNSIYIEGGIVLKQVCLAYDEDKIYFFKLIQKSSWFKIF